MRGPAEIWLLSHMSQLQQVQSRYQVNDYDGTVGGTHNTSQATHAYGEASDTKKTTLIASQAIDVHDTTAWSPICDIRSAPTFSNAPGNEYYVDPACDQTLGLTYAHFYSLVPSTMQSLASSHEIVGRQLRFENLDESPHMPQAHTTATTHRLTSDELTTPFGSSSRHTASQAEDKRHTAGKGNGPKKKKRQRTPHTAVERRYREALNANIKALHVVVAESERARSGENPLAVNKISKSSTLQSGIEQIRSLSSENAILKREVRTLQARLHDLEKWYPQSQDA